jgi:hypothetical protein
MKVNIFIMTLILYIISREQAQWLIVNNNKIVYQLQFDLKFDQDEVLGKLFFLLKKNKLKISKIKSFGLLIEEASLTQIKVSTAVINALAWQSGAKVYANYNFKGKIEDSLLKVSDKLAKIKQFKALKAVYARKPEITISQKKHKFKLVK